MLVYLPVSVLHYCCRLCGWMFQKKTSECVPTDLRGRKNKLRYNISGDLIQALAHMSIDLFTTGVVVLKQQ